MKTKKIIMFAAALLIAIAASAQNAPAKGKKAPKTPEEKAKKQTEWMKKDLQLTDDQAQQIEDINLKYAKKAETRREALKTEHEKFKAEKEADLKKVLTPDQYAKFDQERKDKQAKREAKKADRKEKMKRCMDEQRASKAPQPLNE
jgi:Spy/CpxP family protein refolding chaperone